MRKASTSFVMSVCPSALPHGKTRLPLDGFSWNLIFEYFSKICLENWISIKIWNNGCFTWRPVYTYDYISLNSSYNDKCFGHNCRENQNTHFVFDNIFSPKKHAFNEIMWKYTVEPDRPQMTIRRMLIECWIPKATNAHSEYVTRLAFSRQQWLHERTSLLRYTYFAGWL